MTESAFVQLVRAMRAAQKEYFATRDVEVLKRAKDLERRVDEAVALDGAVQQDLAL